ncbi:hypothetical protein [Streptomyces sp. Y2F8-2]|nr:hypothetical protein [Streptomyces sp. Y2F8-2]
MTSNDRRWRKKRGRPNEWWFLMLDLASLVVGFTSMVDQLRH